MGDPDCLSTAQSGGTSDHPARSGDATVTVHSRLGPSPRPARTLAAICFSSAQDGGQSRRRRVTSPWGVRCGLERVQVKRGRDAGRRRWWWWGHAPGARLEPAGPHAQPLTSPRPSTRTTRLPAEFTGTSHGNSATPLPQSDCSGSQRCRISTWRRQNFRLCSGSGADWSRQVMCTQQGPLANGRGLF